jgi:cytochrome d ubiquinol oxidase subunit I
MDAYRFWVTVFALSFALGVVSGITMSFQFGTNWPGFMETVGSIAGPLLAYEVLTAFFLEATFLGITLFGQGRVSNRVHTLATVLVALGTTASAFWILVLNSWLHTPVGFEMRDRVADDAPHVSRAPRQASGAHVGALFHLAKKAGEGVRQARPGPAALPAPLAA